jgi:hypothetical protein
LKFQLLTEGKTVKTTNNSTFQADIAKALVKEMSRLGLDPKAAAYVCSTYDFSSYLLEGSLSHLNQQIFHVQTAAGI